MTKGIVCVPFFHTRKKALISVVSTVYTAMADSYPFYSFEIRATHDVRKTQNNNNNMFPHLFNSFPSKRTLKFRHMDLVKKKKTPTQNQRHTAKLQE